MLRCTQWKWRAKEGERELEDVALLLQERGRSLVEKEMKDECALSARRSRESVD